MHADLDYVFLSECLHGPSPAGEWFSDIAIASAVTSLVNISGNVWQQEGKSLNVRFLNLARLSDGLVAVKQPEACLDCAEEGALFCTNQSVNPVFATILEPVSLALCSDHGCFF